MSNNDEEPYSSIFASLKHPVRRKILRMLSKKPMSYSEMLEVLGVSNSFLTYHLENLGELVGKMEDGRYRLSSFGEDAMATMTRVEDIPVNTLHQSPQTKPKKIMWKSFPIAIGLICIVLVAFIAYFAVAGISAQNNYNSIQNQNKQLQTWLAGNETWLNQTETWLIGNETLLQQAQVNNTNLQKQVDYLNSEIASYQNQINNMLETLITAQGFADGLQLTMTLEKANYSLGEPINLTLKITNISNQTIECLWIEPMFDFVVYNDTNNYLYDYDNSAPPQPILDFLPPPVPLNSTQSISSGNLVWPQTYNATAFSEGYPVSAGTYYIVGYAFTTPLHTNPIQVTIAAR